MPQKTKFSVKHMNKYEIVISIISVFVRGNSMCVQLNALVNTFALLCQQ